MNQESRIKNQELTEQEAILRRFDVFKKNLKPDPSRLHVALTRIPDSRRALRLQNLFAPAFALAALMIIFTPVIPLIPPSQLATDLLREEASIDAALASANDSDSAELENADSALDDLATIL